MKIKKKKKKHYSQVAWSITCDNAYPILYQPTIINWSFLPQWRLYTPCKLIFSLEIMWTKVKNLRWKKKKKKDVASGAPYTKLYVYIQEVQKVNAHIHQRALNDPRFFWLLLFYLHFCLELLYARKSFPSHFGFTLQPGMVSPWLYSYDCSCVDFAPYLRVNWLHFLELMIIFARWLD